MTIYHSQTRFYRIVKRTHVNDKVFYYVDYSEKSSAVNGEPPDNSWNRYSEQPTMEQALSSVKNCILDDFDNYVRKTYIEEIL